MSTCLLSHSFSLRVSQGIGINLDGISTQRIIMVILRCTHRPISVFLTNDSNPSAENFRSRKYPNLNPILAADTTLLRYDVRNKPKDTILSTTYYSNCHTPCLGTPASHIRLISQAFPWTIEVKSTQGSVTCELIWDAIHFGLQEPLADSEWGIAVMDRDRRETILNAARKREDKDKDSRLKRIDWLGDTTLFRGLEQDGEFDKLRLLPRGQGCPETWVVKLSSAL